MIPEQLRSMRFCRVRKGEKRPFQKDWQNKPYSYDEINEFFPNENYGVLAGINNLAVLDDDTSDKRLLSLFDKHFKPTFQVRGHYYFILKGWDCKKIVLFDGAEHLGELQGLGSQAVGAGSTHPSGEKYEVVRNEPIITIEYGQFKKVFGQFMKGKENISANKGGTSTLSESDKVAHNTRDGWRNDLTSIDTISISSVLGTSQERPSNPFHDSTTGTNFCINHSQNVWFCFRCNTGGGVAQIIGAKHGVISNCTDSLSTNQFLEVLQVARDHYGLQESQKPTGWACSINISRMAERHGILACSCGANYDFNNVKGLFSCSECGVRGGIKAFARLIATQGAVA